jgi:hypothetical protein
MTIPDDLQALEDEVVAKLQGIFNEREPTMRRLPALLGETSEQGEATVDDKPRYCHARVGSDQDQIKLLNVRTPHTNGLAVVIGYDPAQPDLFQVLSERGGLYAGDNDNPLVTIKHAPQHEWGNPDGFDIPFLQPRQLRGCRPSATNPNSLSINLDGGVYEIGSVLIEWKGSVIEGALDLTTHVPALGMRWVLVTMDAAGPATTAGTAKSLVDLTDIPTSADPTDWRVCAILLKAGDTVITDWPQEQRIVDLRFAGSRSVSPGGGYVDFGNCIVVAKSGGNFDVIQEGLAAATQETHVVLLNGDWAENVITPGYFLTISGLADQHLTGGFGVHIVGADDVGPICTIDDDTLLGRCFINRVLSGGSGDFIGLNAADVLTYKHLSDMHVRIEGGSTGRDVYAATFGAPAGHASTASRCIFSVADAGSGAAVELVGGDVIFDNMCELRNEDTNGTALIISGDGFYQFEHARIEGGVSITGAAEVHFRNCRITGDLDIAGGGARVYGRSCFVGGNITHGTGDKLVVWAVNQAAGKTITGTGIVVPLWMVVDETGHTDHFIGPNDTDRAAYMRLQPSGDIANTPPAGYQAFWTDFLADAPNYKAIEVVAERDGIAPDFGVLRTVAGGSEVPAPALKLGVGWDVSKYITLDEVGNLLYPNAVAYKTTPSLAPPIEGSTYWNPDERTLNIVTGWGPIQQVGHETFARVYNDTGEQIDNGSVISPTGVYWSGWPGVLLAKADSHLTISRTVGMATMDIPDGEFGLGTLYGKVRGLNTVLYPAGTRIWVSATVKGEWTTTKPLFPNYSISLGGISVSDASDGVIYLSVSGAPFDTVLNYWNGSFRESFEFPITSNGTTITGSLQPSGSATELTMIFSGSLYHFSTTPPVLIDLTPGTDTNLQVNYVYVLESTKALTLSTSGWPTGEHIKVSHSLLKSAATTQIEGAMRNQFINDHIQSDNQQGHMTHLGERARKEPARWDSGIQGTLTIESVPDPDDLFVAVTGGYTYQLHKQSFPALDMATGDDIHVVNHPTTPYVTTTNLNTQLTDASGGALNGRHWAFVVWAVQNSGSEPCHLYLNLPSDSYNNYNDAINDPDNFSVYDIPALFQGVGFMVARFVLSHSPAGSGTWTLRATDDLRGLTPNTIAGGGGGAGGATEFTALTDTFASYSGLGLYLLQVAAAETGIEATNTIVLANTGLRLWDTSADYYLTISPGEDLTDNRTINLIVGDTDRTLTLQGNPTLGNWFDQDVRVVGSPTFANLYVPDGGFVGISGDVGWLFDSSNGNISTTGRVGLGTANPANLLDVGINDTAHTGITTTLASAIFQDIVTIVADGSVAARFIIDGFGVMPSFQGIFARGSAASPAAVQLNDVLVRFAGSGHDSVSMGINPRAYIDMVSNETWTNITQSAFMAFITTSGLTVTEKMRITPTGNIGIGTTNQFGSGVGVLGIANAGTNPSANPTGGGVLYSDAGAGKWRGSGGTTTTFGPAEPHCPDCGRDFVLEWENPETGHLIVCLWCLTEHIKTGVVIREC